MEPTQLVIACYGESEVWRHEHNDAQRVSALIEFFIDHRPFGKLSHFIWYNLEAKQAEYINLSTGIRENWPFDLKVAIQTLHDRERKSFM